jgi:hypothetical protein
LVTKSLVSKLPNALVPNLTTPRVINHPKEINIKKYSSSVKGEKK